MKRVMVALDANVPSRLAQLMNAAYGDQGFEFLHEPDFAAANAADEVWTTAFRRFGGEIVISGDRNMAKRPTR